MAAAASHTHDFATAGFGTKVIHVGQEPDAVTGAVSVPISMSTTFAQASPGVVSVRPALPSRARVPRNCTAAAPARCTGH